MRGPRISEAIGYENLKEKLTQELVMWPSSKMPKPK